MSSPKHHKTEWDGIPMLRTLRAVIRLYSEKRLPTSTRIREIAGKNAGDLIRVYFRWGYVSRKAIKTATNRTRKADHCAWYYVITKSGRDKYQKLCHLFPDA